MRRAWMYFSNVILSLRTAKIFFPNLRESPLHLKIPAYAPNKVAVIPFEFRIMFILHDPEEYST